jgi:general secretion pathway protein C
MSDGFWQHARQRLHTARLDPGRLLIAAIALVLIVQAVRLVYTLLTPLSPVGDWQPATAQAIAPADRATIFAATDPFYRNNPADAAASATITALRLQLFGIRMNSASGGGSAIIAGEDGIQKSVGVGEDIQPGVRLTAVRFDHVEIMRGTVRELLYLDQSQGAAGTATVAATTAPGAGASAAPTPLPISPDSIRAGVAFVPRQEGQRVTGIRVSEQGDGTAFAAAGFRSGDVIRSINGRAIAGAGDAAALAGQLQPGARLSLEVERGAEVVPIAIIIPTGTP